MSCGTGANAAVLELGYMLESPREFLKFLVCRPHCRSIKSESTGGWREVGGTVGRPQCYLKAPRQVQPVTMDSDTIRFLPDMELHTISVTLSSASLPQKQINRAKPDSSPQPPLISRRAGLGSLAGSPGAQASPAHHWSSRQGQEIHPSRMG